MALANRDRVQESSTTTGTGTYTLAGAVTGFQSFAAVGDGNSCQYAAWEVDANGNPSGGWECGLGTYTAAGTLLARSSVYASSNGGAAVNWAAGTRRVAVCPQTNGTLVVRQPGGIPGVDQCEIDHDGTNVNIKEIGNAGAVRVYGKNTSCFRVIDINNGNIYLAVDYDLVQLPDFAQRFRFGSTAGNNFAFLGGAKGVLGMEYWSGAATLGGTLRSTPLSPAALSADQNDYNPGVARRYRLATDGSGNKNITGLAISQVDGQECSIVNVSAADTITLVHQATSTAANQFLCTAAANIVLAVNEEALLWYDSTTLRWRVRKI